MLLSKKHGVLNLRLWGSLLGSGYWGMELVLGLMLSCLPSGSEACMPSCRLRVISSNKDRNIYELRYFNIDNNEGEDEE